MLLAGPASPSESPLDVFVSIPPQASVAEQLGGRHLRVHVLVRPGQDPHTFEPTPRQVMTLARAKIFFTIGVPFEDRLTRKIRPGDSPLRIVNTSSGVKKLLFTTGHDHAGRATPDPHFWLSPPLLKIMAANMLAALVNTDPAHAAIYKKNFRALAGRIDSVHSRIKKLLAPYAGESFYVFHPAFAYFGAAYGLTQKAVEMEGKIPSARRLGRIIKQARAEQIRIIFVQPQFDPHSAQAVARAMNGAVVPMDPLRKDILNGLESAARKIAESLMK